MSGAALGISYAVVTLLVMFSGMPIAFGLGAVAVGFMYFFMPASALDTVTQNVYEEMSSITLLSIPLFILKGRGHRPIARRARTLCGHACLDAQGAGRPGHRQRLRPARCSRRWPAPARRPARRSAVAGIPEMRRRGYSPGFAAGIIAAGGTLGILLPAVGDDDPVRGRVGAVPRPALPGRHRPGAVAGDAVRRLRGAATTRREHRQAPRAAFERQTALSPPSCSKETVHASGRNSRCCRAWCPSCYSWSV